MQRINRIWFFIIPLVMLIGTPLWLTVYHTKVAQARLYGLAQINHNEILAIADQGCERRPNDPQAEPGEALPLYLQAVEQFDSIDYQLRLANNTTHILDKTPGDLIQELNDKHPIDKAAAIKVLSAYQQPLDLVYKAQQQRYFCLPTNHTEKFFIAEYPGYRFNNLFDLLWIKDQVAIAKGDRQSAIDMILTAIDLGEDLSRLGKGYDLDLNSKVEGLNHYRFLDQLLEMMQQPLSDSELTLIVTRLTRLEYASIPLELRIRWQRFSILASLEEINRTGKFEDMLIVTHCFSKRTRLDELTDWAGRYWYGYHNMPHFIDWTAKFVTISQQLESSANESPTLFIATGNNLDQQNNEYFHFEAWIYFNYWQSIAKLRTALILAALQQYKNAHGRFPDELAALSSDLPASTLIDPFKEQPFRYWRNNNGQIANIWSSNRYWQDDHGEVIAVTGRYYSVE